MRHLLLCLTLFLAGCATGTTAPVALAGPASVAPASVAPVSADSLDVIARDYVALILEIGEREPGYVDAYYGPAEWQAEAKASPRSLPELAEGAQGLTRRLEGLQSAGLDEVSLQRRNYLLAHVSAAGARVRMLSGEVLSFADEAEALFGIRPELKSLTAYDEVLQKIDALVPGPGPLLDRVTAFRQSFVIPRDRLEVVMQAAMAECRARTVRHIPLPDNERFTLALVGDKPWSGYNYYLGGSVSKIEINADFPIYTDRAIDLGCHEGYPGHHVYNALLEQTFVREKGWMEMSVYPLFSPMSLIAEGTANYGIDLAFPGSEALAYERDVLMPLAGLAPADVAKKAELMGLMRQLARAEYTIADDYLAGRVGREDSIERLSRYNLTLPERSAQRLRFIDTYRSYVINYGLGRDMVQAWIATQGPDEWATMRRLLASQTLPVDLAPVSQP